MIVFDADLSNATKADVFKKAFPNRHFNCGIAEGNMIAAAAGAAAMGMVPFASSFAMFKEIEQLIISPHTAEYERTHGPITLTDED